MSFIRTQHIAYDDSGKIVKGSASICESSYVRTGKKHHGVQRQVESLGNEVDYPNDPYSHPLLDEGEVVITVNSL